MATLAEIRAKLTELGFCKNTKKVEKKKETKKKPKITKKYEAKGAETPE